LVWSQTYSGDNIFGSIPAEITNQYDFDYVSFTEVSTGSSASGLHASGGGASVIIITDPAESPLGGYVQALIVVPDFQINLYDYRTISTVKQAFRYRGICYAKLSGSNAAYDKVAWYARNNNIKYLYINAHGGYLLDEDDPSTLRTYVFLGDDPVISIKRSDYSNPDAAPPWCKNLGLEGAVNSFAMMGFTSLEFAYFDCCYSGRL
jgi:hypothetical protein